VVIREVLITLEQRKLITVPSYSKEFIPAWVLIRDSGSINFSSYFSTHDHTYKINSDKKKLGKNGQHDMEGG